MAPVVQLLHTRMLDVRLARDPGDHVTVTARLLDVRKHGVVRLAGTVNGPGVVHDMGIRLVIDGESRAVRSAELLMPVVPFPGGDRTRGESCRDNEARFDGVVGLRFGPRFLTALHRTIGGPRGCFHVFTLMRLLGPTIPWVIERGRENGGDGTSSRTVSIDAFCRDGRLCLQGRLTDLRCGGPPMATLADRLEAESEAELDVPSLTVTAVAARHRRGTGPGDLGWTVDGLDGIEQLVGASILRGYGLMVDRLFPPPKPVAPVGQLLLMMQPVAFQSLPSLAHAESRTGSARGTGSPAARDSCSMWRHDGPLVAEVAGGVGGGTH